MQVRRHEGIRGIWSGTGRDITSLHMSHISRLASFRRTARSSPTPLSEPVALLIDLKSLYSSAIHEINVSLSSD